MDEESRPAMTGFSEDGMGGGWILRMIRRALATKIPGGSLGDWELKQDTWHLLLLIDIAFAPECDRRRRRRVFDTKIITQPSGGKWSERWIVSRGGTNVTYTVDFVAAPGGGTTFSVRRVGQ